MSTVVAWVFDTRRGRWHNVSHLLIAFFFHKIFSCFYVSRSTLVMSRCFFCLFV